MKEDGSMWDFQVKQSREDVKKIFLGDMSPKLRPSPLSAIFLGDKKEKQKNSPFYKYCIGTCNQTNTEK